MPNQHRYPLTGIRGAPPELVQRARNLARDHGHSLSEVTIEFWRWWVAETSDLPERALKTHATQKENHAHDDG